MLIAIMMAAALADAPAFLANPAWAQQPSPTDWLNFYPERALRADMGGVGVADCVAQADGSLDRCVVGEETPKGWSFGIAATVIARKRFKLAPSPQAAGAHVRVVVSYRPSVARTRFAAAQCYAAFAAAVKDTPGDAALMSGATYFAQTLNDSLAADDYSAETRKLMLAQARDPGDADKGALGKMRTRCKGIIP